MPRVLGIDPGINSGGAIISVPDFKLISVIPLPTVPDGKDGKRRVLDAFQIMCWTLHHKVTHAVIENVQPMPSFKKPEGDDEEEERRGMGAVSAFRYGGAVIGARLILNCARIEPRKVTAQVWKKRYGLDSDKRKSRQMAAWLYPLHEELFDRVKDGNVAEAVLIARYEAEMIAGLRPNIRLPEFHRTIGGAKAVSDEQEIPE